MTDKPLYIFLHHLKCGGNTVREMLYSGLGYPNVNWVDIPHVRNQGIPDHVKAIGGHLHFGVHAYISRPCRYITLLRNPVDRAISDYFYCLSLDRDRHHNAVTSSLYDWADVIGPGSMTRASCWRSEEYGNGRPSVSVMQAVDNWGRYYDHVGTLERWKETEDWLVDNLACERPSWTANRNPYKPPVWQEDRDYIASRIKDDFALWQMASGIEPAIAA